MDQVSNLICIVRRTRLLIFYPFCSLSKSTKNHFFCVILNVKASVSVMQASLGLLCDVCCRNLLKLTPFVCGFADLQLPVTEPDINNRLESLCLSMTEHALGGTCPLLVQFTKYCTESRLRLHRQNKICY